LNQENTQQTVETEEDRLKALLEPKSYEFEIEGIKFVFKELTYDQQIGLGDPKIMPKSEFAYCCIAAALISPKLTTEQLKKAPSHVTIRLVQEFNEHFLPQKKTGKSSPNISLSENPKDSPTFIEKV